MHKIITTTPNMNMTMEGQTIAPTRRLYAAVIKGDLPIFLDLLREDPLIVDRCVIENSMGGFNRSPLHVAVHMGYLEMVKTLLNVCPSMCLAHDKEGRNPIHVAAIQGRVNVLEVLHQANPHAAQEKSSDGQTILHSCVKHNQLNALKSLLKLVNGDGDQLLNSKDNNGNTVLHLAVAGKQSEIVEYLLANTTMQKNSINLNKMTALDIHMKQSRKNLGDEKIELALKRSKAKPAKNALNRKANTTWYEEQRTSLMVVASLIATMAFQVGINPPGGVWQDNKLEPEEGVPSALRPASSDYHKAGFAIWSDSNPNDLRSSGFNMILFCNTLALLSSLSVLLLLISGFQCKRYFLAILRVTLWITVAATTLTYCFAVFFLAHSNFTATFVKVLAVCIIGWLLLITVIASGNVVRFMSRSLYWQKESIRRFCNKWFSRSRHSTTTPTNDHNHGEMVVTI